MELGDQCHRDAGETILKSRATGLIEVLPLRGVESFYLGWGDINSHLLKDRVTNLVDVFSILSLG